VAVGHTVVGAVLERRALAAMLRSGPIDAVARKPSWARAWWFIVPGPLLWTTGQLLRAAETAGDRPAQREAAVVIVALGAAGVTVMPRSPFWVVLAAGLTSLIGRTETGGAPADDVQPLTHEDRARQ
jgi:hypothetical protein